MVCILYEWWIRYAKIFYLMKGKLATDIATIIVGSDMDVVEEEEDEDFQMHDGQKEVFVKTLALRLPL